MKNKLRIILGVMLVVLLSSDAFANIQSEEQFHQFFNNYYKEPKPKAIPQALEYFLSSELFMFSFSNNWHVIEITAYFFGRAAEEDPNLLRAYEKIYKKVGREGKAFIITTFSIFRDQGSEDFLRDQLVSDISSYELIMDILKKPPLKRESFVKSEEGVNNIDFLWVEYFFTGEKEPIGKIIDVLGWEDRFAQKLDDWFENEHTEAESEKVEVLFKQKLGLTLNAKEHFINFNGDFDTLYATYLNQSQQKKGEGEEIHQILGMSQTDIVHMATKGIAYWSLITNTHSHPKLHDIYQNEVEQRQGKSFVELKRIIELSGKK